MALNNNPSYVLSRFGQGSVGEGFALFHMALAGTAQMWAGAFTPKTTHSHGWQVDVDCRPWFLSICIPLYGLYFLTV